MALKDVDLEAGLRRLAERRIEEAMREGKFDNLPGAGQPIELEPIPADEKARLMWWALKILRNNDFIPDEVQWRKRIETLKGMLVRARDERAVRSLVNQINELVLKLNTLGTNAMNAGIAPVRLDLEMRRLWQRHNGGHLRPCDNDLCAGRNPLLARFCRRCGALLPAA